MLKIWKSCAAKYIITYRAPSELTKRYQSSCFRTTELKGGLVGGWVGGRWGEG